MVYIIKREVVEGDIVIFEEIVVAVLDHAS